MVNIFHRVYVRNYRWMLGGKNKVWCLRRVKWRWLSLRHLTGEHISCRRVWGGDGKGVNLVVWELSWVNMRRWIKRQEKVVKGRQVMKWRTKETDMYVVRVTCMQTSLEHGINHINIKWLMCKWVILERCVEWQDWRVRAVNVSVQVVWIVVWQNELHNRSTLGCYSHIEKIKMKSLWSVCEQN